MSKGIALVCGEKIPNTRLRYVREADRTNPKRRRADFTCECGATVNADVNYVRQGQVKSCGCLKTEIVTEKNTTHSHAVRGEQSGAYRSWAAMHQRVKSDERYKGIVICAQWYSFESFFMDMGDRPNNHTIERVDNLGNYEPGNCVWATRAAQSQNTKMVVNVTISGETHSINEWCRMKNIGYHVIKQRRARGMSLEDAITTPINKSKQGRKK